MKTSFADVVLRYLEAEGVECVFGVPGTTVVPLLAAFNRNPAIKPVLTRHEEGAAFMADGYARVSGKLGACFSTSGPGATNLVSGVATAHMDNTPIVVITGQVETSVYGKGAFQDSTREGVDSVKMFEPITRHSSMIVSRHKAIEDLQTALRRATSGRRGPVHLSIPKDVQAAEVEFEGVAPATYRFSHDYFDRRAVIAAAEELVKARRPAMLVGAGAVISGACDDIRELAELLFIPVATTPKAKGAFPDDHPLALGTLGVCGSPLAESFLKSGEVDVLLVVGSSLNQLTTLSWDPRLKPSRCLIHVSIDPTEIGRNYPAELPLVGDARTVVSEIYFRVLRHVAEHEIAWKQRQEAIAVARAATPMMLDAEKLESSDVPFKPQRVIHELQQVLPDDALLFVDVGNALMWVIHYLKVRRPGSVVMPLGLQTMGYGIAAAIGGKLAAKERPVVCLAGDGCFLMNGMEIHTAVGNQIPIVFVIMRNDRLGLVHELQRFALGEKTVATRFAPVDAARVAEGFGALALRAEKPGDLIKLLPQAIASGRTAVIDCPIDPAEVPPLAPFVKGAKAHMERLALV